MDFDQYQKLANKTLYGNEQVLTKCGLGLANETGQVLELIQRYTFEGENLDKQALTKELGDVLWYVSQIAEWADLSFQSIAEANITMLENRFVEVSQQN